MAVRFKRVQTFLSYLDSEEKHEASTFDLARRGETWAESFVPEIMDQVNQEISWIERRLRMNAEKVAEDMSWGGDENDELEEEDEPDPADASTDSPIGG
jgi:hypothetical protein